LCGWTVSPTLSPVVLTFAVCIERVSFACSSSRSGSRSDSSRSGSGSSSRSGSRSGCRSSLYASHPYTADGALPFCTTTTTTTIPTTTSTQRAYRYAVFDGLTGRDSSTFVPPVQVTSAAPVRPAPPPVPTADHEIEQRLKPQTSASIDSIEIYGPRLDQPPPRPSTLGSSSLSATDVGETTNPYANRPLPARPLPTRPNDYYEVPGSMKQWGNTEKGSPRSCSEATNYSDVDMDTSFADRVFDSAYCPAPMHRPTPIYRPAPIYHEPAATPCHIAFAVPHCISRTPMWHAVA
jgi:hypothetical protein